MKKQQQRDTGALSILLITLMALTIFPLPEWLRPLRPHWVPLFILYISIFSPKHSGVIRSWLLGIVVDVITGSYLGLHALMFAMTSFIALKFQQRLLVSTILLQLITITSITTLNITIEWIVREFTDTMPIMETIDIALFWAPAITTPPLWIPLFLVADSFTKTRS